MCSDGSALGSVLADIFEVIEIKEEEKFDGYINKISLNGKLYKIGVEVLEARPIVCKKCGASFQMKYGEGRCDHCGTYYTTHCYIEETDAN